MISRSMDGRSCGALSMTVTRTPSVANMLAYSRPITPAPTIVMVRGTLSRVQHVVAQEYTFTVERDMRHGRGSRSSGDHDGGRRYLAMRRPVQGGKSQSMGVDERRLRGDQLDAVAHQLVAHNVDLMSHDVLGPEQQVLHADVLLDRVRLSVQFALAVSGEIKRRLTKSLTRDRPRVEHDPADDVVPLDERHALIDLRGLHRSTLAGWARPDYHYVVIVLSHQLQGGLGRVQVLRYECVQRAYCTTRPDWPNQ